MLIVVTLQTLVLASYGFRINRRYYRALAAGTPAKMLPRFRALPSSFIFPHMQLLLLMSFASGLTTNTVSVYGVDAAGLTISTVLYAFSLTTSVLLMAFFAWQLLAVVRFHRSAGKALWVAEPPLESVHEMDDPLLRLLARLKLMRPRMRGRGEYAPAEDAMAEPARTQRALRRAMTWGGILECLPWIRKRQPPLSTEQHAAARYEELAIWLGDGAGSSLRGSCYVLVLTMLQLLIAVFIQIYAVLGERNAWAQRSSLIACCVLQLLMAVWTVCGDPVDALDALFSCLASTFEFVATTLLLAASHAEGDAARQLGERSADLLLASVCVPMVLTVYDSLVMPLIRSMHARITSGQPFGRALIGIGAAVVLLPVTIATAFMGFEFKGQDALTTMIEDEAEAAAETAETAEKAAPLAAPLPARSHPDIKVEIRNERERQLTASVSA